MKVGAYSELTVIYIKVDSQNRTCPKPQQVNFPYQNLVLQGLLSKYRRPFDQSSTVPVVKKWSEETQRPRRVEVNCPVYVRKTVHFLAPSTSRLEVPVTDRQFQVL